MAKVCCNIAVGHARAVVITSAESGQSSHPHEHSLVIMLCEGDDRAWQESSFFGVVHLLGNHQADCIWAVDETVMVGLTGMLARQLVSLRTVVRH